MSEITLPYAFAYQNGVLIRSDGSIIYRDGASTEALLEARRILMERGEFRLASRKEFEAELAENYSSSARQAAAVAADQEDDLVSLADSVAAIEDLLDEGNDAPIVRLINALFSEAIHLSRWGIN